MTFEKHSLKNTFKGRNRKSCVVESVQKVGKVWLFSIVCENQILHSGPNVQLRVLSIVPPKPLKTSNGNTFPIPKCLNQITKLTKNIPRLKYLTNRLIWRYLGRGRIFTLWDIYHLISPNAITALTHEMLKSSVIKVTQCIAIIDITN